MLVAVGIAVDVGVGVRVAGDVAVGVRVIVGVKVDVKVGVADGTVVAVGMASERLHADTIVLPMSVALSFRNSRRDSINQ